MIGLGLTAIGGLADGVKSLFDGSAKAKRKEKKEAKKQAKAQKKATEGAEYKDAENKLKVKELWLKYRVWIFVALGAIVLIFFIIPYLSKSAKGSRTRTRSVTRSVRRSAPRRRRRR